jgi:hypothetical protein
MCLNSAYGDLMFGRHHLEQLRAWLFRAEQLIDTQSLPARQTTPKFPGSSSVLVNTRGWLS